MMLTIRKNFIRARALARRRRRGRELAALLSEHFRRPVALVPSSIRGYDDIYAARHRRETLALVRVINPEKIDLWRNRTAGLPISCLPAEARLDREWEAYSVLGPRGLSPRALWRCEDATAAERLNMPRASDVLRRRPDKVWDVLELTFPAVRAMHGLGVVHLDLGVSNILLDLDARRVAFIDFEYAPAVPMNLPTQRAYDYLRVINNCLKPRRGGDLLAHDRPRLARLLAAHLADDAPLADAIALFRVIPKVASDIPLRRALAATIPSLAPTEHAA